MTGIERLRRYASDMRDSGWKSMHDDLSDIADLIEREYGRSAETVRAEAMEAWRWVRERGGLATLQLHEETFADLMRQRDEYRALARDYERDATWVRDHGGLDHVRAEWRSLVPRDSYEMMRQRLLGHIAECETALGRRNERIKELKELGRRVSDLTTENAGLRRRAMPEGCEWPSVDGKPVDFVTGYEPSLGVLDAVCIYSNGACEVMGHDGIIKDVEEIHVATPKVLDADGAEIRMGDTVWTTRNLDKFTVTNPNNGKFLSVGCKGEDGEDYCCYPTDLTHRAPVLAADGRPLEVGQTVWHTKGCEQCTVLDIESGSAVSVEFKLTDDGCRNTGLISPSHLTHKSPDSWERIEEDAANLDEMPCNFNARDLVRRCRALAERERDE